MCIRDSPEPGSNSPRTACETASPTPRRWGVVGRFLTVLERVIFTLKGRAPTVAPEGRAGCPTRLPVSKPDASRRQASAGTNPTMVTAPRLESRGSVTPELLSFQRPARRWRDLQDYQPDSCRATRQSAKNRPGNPRAADLEVCPTLPCRSNHNRLRRQSRTTKPCARRPRRRTSTRPPRNCEASGATVTSSIRSSLA